MAVGDRGLLDGIDIPGETWLETLIRYGLYFGAVFQIVCILCLFWPASTERVVSLLTSRAYSIYGNDPVSDRPISNRFRIRLISSILYSETVSEKREEA